MKNTSHIAKPQRIIDTNALEQTAEVIARHCPEAKSLLLVADENTWEAAGAQVATRLASGYTITKRLLGRSAKPHLQAAETLAAEAAGIDVLLAIGAGSINDITKFAADRARKPYFSLATGASMNGYSSATASLFVEGLKRSFPAAPPRAVIADITVLAAAPRRMLRAGLADTLCRSTVEADMALSHLVLGTPYPTELFAKMRTHEPALIASATAAREGDHGFIATLMQALLDGGDAMAEFGSSAVASQGEHMIAHTLELMYGAEIYDVLHGELIGLTTTSMSRLQQKTLLGTPLLRALPREEKLFLRSFGKRLSYEMYADYQRKLLHADQLTAIEKTFDAGWMELKNTLREILLTHNTIERVFMQIGLAIKPQDLMLDEERYRNACTYAYLTRDRFGFLDLAAMNDKRVG